MVADAVMIATREQVLFEYRHLVDFVLSIPERLTAFIQNTQETFNRILKYGPVVASGT